MNSKKSRRLCLNCNKECKRHTAFYCSNRCQQELRIKHLIEQWLITGKCKIYSGSNNYLRNYILKEQNNKCTICELKQEWNNKKLIFILDHIDGNHNHCNRENLRMICPNCDSQLSTYKSKNIGKGRINRRKL